jgi:cytochrome c-type biogenesis protein CcmH
MYNSVKNINFNVLAIFRVLTFSFLTLLPFSVNAVIEIAPLSSAELEARYRDLIEELRCPKCQNQNLADSNSPISADLREQVRVLLEEGKTDDEVIEYLVHRYGEFVRYRPAVKENTWALWFGPLILLMVCLAVVVFIIRNQRRAVIEDATLSEEERAHIERLLASDKKDETS